MKKKNLFASFYYSLGVFTGQLYLLIKSIHKTNKEFSEFDKWLKKLQKEGRIELRKKTEKTSVKKKNLEVYR